jgi:protein-S-isoprenylcysteine O-methyltransferase Ste14
MNAGRIILLVVLFFLWYLLSAVALPPALLLAVALLGPFGLLLSAWIGRRALDRDPAPDPAQRVTEVFHIAVMALLGSAAIAAVRYFQVNPGWYFPMPEWLGLTLVILAGLLLLASTANLILSGLGVPIAVLQTRQLASDWLYAWTRNPIVLSGLVLLICMGLWLHSTGLVLWTLLLVTPIAVAVLRIFEERELEIRFGEDYLAYKARTPMLIPRILRSTGQAPTIKTGPR